MAAVVFILPVDKVKTTENPSSTVPIAFAANFNFGYFRVLPLKYQQHLRIMKPFGKTKAKQIKN